MGEEAILLQAKTFERLCLGQLHETVGPGPEDDPMRHYLQVLDTHFTAAVSGDNGKTLVECAAECAVDSENDHNPMDSASSSNPVAGIVE